MFKTLVKKQFAEVFRSYYYDAKRNKARSREKTIAFFVLFAVLMIAVLGGIFTWLSLMLCRPLLDAYMGFLYFVLMGGIAIALGSFGSIFNTYSGLYLSKDNDLLLSMPIPLKYIIGSRLLNVYILGGMYSIIVILPAVIVYWVVAGITIESFAGGIAIILVISFIVLIISCLLGWCIAKVSLKLKSKGILTALVGLVFMGAYFFICFRANDMIATLIEKSVYYGAVIKDGYYAAYLFGRIGEGDFTAIALWLGICAGLMILTWVVLRKTFIGIATASGSTRVKKVRKEKIKERSVSRALLTKEFARFTSSPNYMLNCGIGMIFVPLGGIMLLIKGDTVNEVLNMVFMDNKGAAMVLMCTALCALASMNNMAAPSVSLEGKSIWILQSLPVDIRKVLHAKLKMHLILTGAVMIFTCICVAIVLEESLLICAVAMLFCLFTSAASLSLGVKMANLSWTSEITVIKQSGAVTISLFGSWAVIAVFAGLYFLIGDMIGATAYLAVWACVFAAASVFMLRWLDTRGVERFMDL